MGRFKLEEKRPKVSHIHQRKISNITNKYLQYNQCVAPMEQGCCKGVAPIDVR